MVIRAADDIRKHVLCTLVLAIAILMYGVYSQGQRTRLTIVQICRLGVNGPLDDGKLDLIKLFTFDADSLRQAQPGIFECFVLCFVNTRPV